MGFLLCLLCLFPLMMNPPVLLAGEEAEAEAEVTDHHVHAREDDEDEEEAQENVAANLPVGFRFKPTDKELVSTFLVKRASNKPLSVNHMHELDREEIFKYPPDKLVLAVTNSRGKDMCFFTRMSRPRKKEWTICITDSSGLWRSTEDDVKMCDSEGKRIASKRSLNYFRGQMPKIARTRWFMDLFWLEDDKLGESDQKAVDLELMAGRLRYESVDSITGNQQSVR